MTVFDPLRLDLRTVRVHIDDLDRLGRYTRALSSSMGVNSYQLRNRHAVPRRGEVLSTHTDPLGSGGSITTGCTVDHFGTEIEVLDVSQPRYSLIAALSGTLGHAGPNGSAEAHGTRGMIVSYAPGGRILTSDASERLVVWVDGTKLERTLQVRLDEPLRDRLAFKPGVDWRGSEGRVVWRMIRRLLEELHDSDGLLSDPITREAFADLFLQTVLSHLPHNYTDRLNRPVGRAIPRHLRRAEAFMHASADQPISINDVAAASGCGSAALYAAFRQFRDTTPFAALHCIRLQRVRETLQVAGDEVSTRSIARRFGFSNPSRFIASYGRQFSEHPNETRRRGTGLSS